MVFNSSNNYTTTFDLHPHTGRATGFNQDIFAPNQQTHQKNSGITSTNLKAAVLALWLLRKQHNHFEFAYSHREGLQDLI